MPSPATSGITIRSAADRDTLTEGERCRTRHSYFAPELFRVTRTGDPFRPSSFRKVLQENGPIRSSNARGTTRVLLGRGRELQSTWSDRLAREYKVDALYDPATIATAAGHLSPMPDHRNFENETSDVEATDVDGNPVVSCGE